jgi:hypothetical protein
MNYDNLRKLYIVESKWVNLVRMVPWLKTRGGNMQVTSIMLLKTNVDKVSEIRLSIMLMKNKIVIGISPLC